MHVIRQLGAAVSALAASVFMLAACRGCSSADDVPTTQQEDAGADADARRDVVTDPKHEGDAASEGAADSPLDALVEHEGVPPGWQAWTGWSAACPIYIPGPGAELPPPIEWEPCPPALTQQSACRVMKNTWAGSTSISTRFWRNPSSGTAILKFARPSTVGGVQLVPFIIAEIDGKVRHAHLYPLSLDVPSDCGYFEEDFGDGLYVLDAPARQQTGPDFGSTTIDGVIGGPMSNPVPSVLALTKENSSWRVSADWLVQLTLGKINAWTWDGNLSHNVYAGGNDPNGLQPHVPLVRGKDIFFTVGGAAAAAALVWRRDTRGG